MKETYAVKLPKHIVFGDPWYFEMYSGEKLNSLIVDNGLYKQALSHICRVR